MRPTTLVAVAATLSLLVPVPPPAGAAPNDPEEAPAGPVEEAPEEAPASPVVEVSGVVDLRLVGASEPTSWLEGGVGRSRYGGVDRDRDLRADRWGTAFHLSQLSLVVAGRLREDLRAHLHVNVGVDDERASRDNPVGVVEAFIAWSPVLGERARLKLRGGITIPPFSLEHPEPAWSTRYTVTPSAIASWLGEEVKSTGVEGTLVLGLGSFHQLELQAGVFSRNDSSGALLAWRGWALHDRQGQSNDELPLPAILSLTDERFFLKQGTRTEPFREVDGRPGFHGQARLRLAGHLMLQGGYWDSNGDVRSVDVDDGPNYTWDTRFALAGAELQAGPLTVVGQYLDGNTEMGFLDPRRVDAPIRAGFALASVLLGSTRLSFRWDGFAVDDRDPWQEGKDLNREDGWAVTAAVIQQLGARHRLYGEWLRVDVDRPFQVTAGEPGQFTQDQVQAGYRLTF